MCVMLFLIIVGNFYILSYDVYWRSFIDYCRLNDSYIGCDFDGKSLVSMGDEDGDEMFVECFDEIDCMFNEEVDVLYEFVDFCDNE